MNGQTAAYQGTDTNQDSLLDQNMRNEVQVRLLHVA